MPATGSQLFGDAAAADDSGCMAQLEGDRAAADQVLQVPARK
jgi:hypothetical protein